MSFVHPFAASAISEEEVVLNKAFPLVRELVHKYGLKVLGIKRLGEDRTNTAYDRLFLARDDGILLCKVFFYREKEAYAIRNIVAYKDRGRTSDDKLTFFGKKVSFVMKAVDSMKMIPDTLTFINKVHSRNINTSIQRLTDQFGEMRKGNMIDGETVHNLMEIALGNRSLSALSIESMEKVKAAVDKYRHIDSMRIERQREICEVFERPMWVVYYDDTGSFGVGKMNIKPKWAGTYSEALEGSELQIVEDFKRLRDPTEESELIPALAMLKNHLEQKYPNMEFAGESKFFPRDYEGVIPELRTMAFMAGDRWNKVVLGQPKFLIIPT